MIGRGALVKSWLFRDIWSYLTTGVVPGEPTIAEKCGLIRQHFRNLLHFRNERVAVCEFRKRISWYAKTMHPCRMLKDAMRVINTTADFEKALEDYQAWRAQYDEDLAAGRIRPIPTDVALDEAA